MKEGLKKDFARYVIAQHDLKVAAVMWRRAGESMAAGDLFAAAAFKSAFFASYGRLFTPSRKSPSIISERPPFVRREHQAVHDALMDARHGYIAHSDKELRRVRLFPPGAPIDGRPHSAPDSGEWKWAVRNLEFQINYEDLGAHLASMGNVIDEKVQELLSRLVGTLDAVPTAETELGDL
ncbi:MAG: hypothetical protein U1E73_09765 [Planctomycetota bacterium]